jgi:hypothetical protein
MTPQSKTIATFATPEEAHIAIGVLQNAGIVAHLEDTNVPGALGLAGSLMREVNLRVAEEDEARARDVLAQETATPPEDATSARACPKCGAPIPRGFDTCWSCESPKDDSSQ